MRKQLFILFAFLSFPVFMNAQGGKSINTTANTYNKYLIKIDTSIIHNIQTTGDYLKMVCVANTYTYNATTKYYEVLTKRDLEYNIISGKLQKNMTPMADFILVGKTTIIPSAQTSTISTQ